MLTNVDYKDLLNKDRFNNLYFNLLISVDTSCADHIEWINFVRYMTDVAKSSLSRTDLDSPENTVNRFWYESEFNDGVDLSNVEYIVQLIDKLAASLPEDKYRISLMWYSPLESR